MPLPRSKLIAASELGSFHVTDLDIFDKGYCAFLKDVWAAVPVVWEGVSRCCARRLDSTGASSDGEHTGRPCFLSILAWHVLSSLNALE